MESEPRSYDDDDGAPKHDELDPVARVLLREYPEIATKLYSPDLNGPWCGIISKNGDLVEVNAACANGLGRRREDLVGKQAREVLRPGDSANEPEELPLEIHADAEANPGQSYRYESWVPRDPLALERIVIRGRMMFVPSINGFLYYDFWPVQPRYRDLTAVPRPTPPPHLTLLPPGARQDEMFELTRYSIDRFVDTIKYLADQGREQAQQEVAKAQEVTQGAQPRIFPPDQDPPRDEQKAERARNALLVELHTAANVIQEHSAFRPNVKTFAEQFPGKEMSTSGLGKLLRDTGLVPPGPDGQHHYSSWLKKLQAEHEQGAGMCCLALHT